MYKSILNEIESKINIKRSIFIANLKYVENEKSAKEHIKKISKKYIDASHNVWAYRVLQNKNILENYSDAGEPSGSAGRPVLDTLKRFSLVNVSVVVTRYFGGIKLGIRGLIEAYSNSVKEAIEKSQLIDLDLAKRFIVECEYENQYLLEGFVRKYDFFKVESINYTDKVIFTISVMSNKSDFFENFLKNHKIKFQYIADTLLVVTNK